MNNINNKKTNNQYSSYGTSIAETEIHPALLAFKRSQLVEKSFLRGEKLQYGENLEDINSHYNKDGSVFIDEVVINGKTLDTFRRNIVRYPSRFADVYEGLLYELDDINGLTGSYIKFEYTPNDDGNGKFKEILYRHFSNGYQYFLRSYTDDELNTIIKESPNHPMIQLMNKTLNNFKILENLPSAKDLGYNQSKNETPISESAAQMQ